MKENLQTNSILCLNENSGFYEYGESASRFENVDVSPTDTSFTIYTSGTTGFPKIIEINHQGILWCGEVVFGGYEVTFFWKSTCYKK